MDDEQFARACRSRVSALTVAVASIDDVLRTIAAAPQDLDGPRAEIARSRGPATE